MGKKIIIILTVICLIGIGIIIYFINNSNQIVEYIPEEEISKEDFFRTNILLYFQNKNTNQLEVESRSISSKELLYNPYKIILETLINGPENENLEKIIPEGTKINSIILEKHCLKIDFSKEFIENCIEDKIVQENIINSISKTLTQLTEVSKIKILIDGVEGLGFPNGEIKF